MAPASCDIYHVVCSIIKENQFLDFNVPATAPGHLRLNHELQKFFYTSSEKDNNINWQAKTAIN